MTDDVDFKRSVLAFISLRDRLGVVDPPSR